MKVQPSTLPPQASDTAATASQKTVDEARKSGNIQEYVRTSTNDAILKASLQVSISSGDESQQLLFRTAIDNLNEVLKPDFGEDALAAQANEDQSPDATAERIVSLTTGLFAKFLEQRPGVDEATAAQQFRDIIERGIDQGFGEARDILDGLKVLNGDIASNIDKTYERVQSRLDEFFARYAAPDEEAGQAPAST